MKITILKKISRSFFNFIYFYKICFFILFILPFYSIDSLKVKPDELILNETKAVVLGHLYPIMQHDPKILNKLFHKIKNVLAISLEPLFEKLGRIFSKNLFKLLVNHVLKSNIFKPYLYY